MAVFGDMLEEWKKASPKEKFLIAGGGIAVLALAWYLHSKSSNSSLTGTGTAGLPGTAQPGTGSPGGVVPVPPQPVPGNPPGDNGNPPFYNPPAPGSPDQGNNPAPPGVNDQAYVTPAGSVLNGTFGRNTYTQMQHRGILPGPAPSAGAAVLGGTFGRNATTQGRHKGTIPDPGAPPEAPYGAQPPVYPKYPIGGYRRTQPTATTQVYGATRHAPSYAPVSKPRAF